VPTLSVGGCKDTDVVLRIPGVFEDPAPNTSEWIQESGTPQDFKLPEVEARGYSHFHGII
jgi:hypothetical protein